MIVTQLVGGTTTPLTVGGAAASLPDTDVIPAEGDAIGNDMGNEVGGLQLLLQLVLLGRWWSVRNDCGAVMISFSSRRWGEIGVGGPLSAPPEGATPPRPPTDRSPLWLCRTGRAASCCAEALETRRLDAPLPPGPLTTALLLLDDMVGEPATGGGGVGGGATAFGGVLERTTTPLDDDCDGRKMLSTVPPILLEASADDPGPWWSWGVAGGVSEPLPPLDPPVESTGVVGMPRARVGAAASNGTKRLPPLLTPAPAAPPTLVGVNNDGLPPPGTPPLPNEETALAPKEPSATLRAELDNSRFATD